MGQTLCPHDLVPTASTAFLIQATSHYVLYFLVGALLYEALRRVGGLWIFATPPSPGGAVNRFFLLAGDASYSIYLTHSFVLGPSARIWDLVSIPQAAWPLFVLAMLATTSAFGIAVHVLVEKPLLNALRPLLPKPRAAAAVQARGRGREDG